ncbi:hypothetical protein POX_c03889 [Penicillium oxalicum]|uniref:hypothetical protein n=1 Tax=Penicillium oxalicum TaxID=69781 RepID=UPI0020B70271|nr:hypothetical protein POX_c03889 [Penicillium oxalicum]KAI2791034.1 hypothetical protein POX_c03889 [Penicillium oxalicum]
MTTFSLVALPIVALILIVRHYHDIRNWIAKTTKKIDRCRNGAPVQTPVDVQRMAPYPAQPIKGRERYRVMMDIRKLDTHNWLTLDKHYLEEHSVRNDLLRDKRDEVLQCLPESAEACHEALQEVSEFLCERYPHMFEKVIRDDTQSIHNRMTGERFAIRGSACSGEGIDALEAAVRLTMEDLSILMMNEDGEYYLAASASLFPTGWTPKNESDGQFLACMDLSLCGTNRLPIPFLARLTPNSPMERSNYFVEIKRPDENLIEILYRPQGLCEKHTRDPSPSEILIRRERQTFRRLPQSGTILFGVKTYLTTLDQLPMQELENLVREMKTWPDYVGEYKGKDVWGTKVLEYYKTRTLAAQMKDNLEV